MSTSTSSSNKSGLLPKIETQAYDFLNNTNYNGDNIVVAILDTGVDPGAIGLQTCPNGEPKVIDNIDCTGSGDVDTSTIVNGIEENNNLYIIGKSGKKILLNKNWINPNNEWHIGIKLAEELYPRGLKQRVKDERLKEFHIKNREKLLIAEKNLENYKKNNDISLKLNSTSVDIKYKKDLENLENLINYLNDINTNYNDPGPLYDCIVWYDGNDWQSVIDINETGDLRNSNSMTDYHKKLQYSTFSNIDNLNYCVNIFDNGNILSIVCDAGSHGTHVAGITSAYYPNDSTRNGIAPGAKIISLKIGDTRLGSMETGTGLIRALKEAIRLKVDLINMSYGEATSLPNHGIFIKLAEEAVYEHNIMFISSAGNNGPALTTVGAPGGSTSCIMSIAAFVSNSMMEDAYSMRENVPESNYTWSSVGPTSDGARGVSIMAPGGAIAPVPNWTLKRNQLMNGTSMSSPNACGCIALILSGLKANNIIYTSNIVRRCIESTAKTYNNVNILAQGHGMIQVEDAYNRIMEEYNKKTELSLNILSSELNYNCFIHDNNYSRGIYIRDITNSSVISTHEIIIEPKFNDNIIQEEKVNFEVNINLECNASYINIPNYILLMNQKRNFQIEINPLHDDIINNIYNNDIDNIFTTYIYGYDSNDTSNIKLPLFEIPINILKPIELLNNKTEIEFPITIYKPGKLKRYFITPPCGSTWMDIIIKDHRNISHPNINTSNLCLIHCLQLLPHTPYRDNEKSSYYRMNPGDIKIYSIKIDSYSTWEIVLGQYWSTIGETSLDMKIIFNGINITGNNDSSSNGIYLGSGQGYIQLRIDSLLKTHLISPSITLNILKKTLSPISAIISPLNDRDMLTKNRQISKLILEYEFNIETKTTIKPTWPILNNVLYESIFISQFYMIYNKNKKLLSCGDAWPKKFTIDNKGKYTIFLMIRHYELKYLNNFKEMKCLLEYDLKGKDIISLNIYNKKESMATLNDEDIFRRKKMLKGESMALFINEPILSSLPKITSPGDLLCGNITICKSDSINFGEGKRPDGFNICYTIPPKSLLTKKSKNDDKNDDNDKTDDELLFESIRSCKLSFLKKKLDNDNFIKLYNNILNDYPNYLPLLQLKLHSLCNKKNNKNNNDIINSANDIINLINQDELAQYFGRNHNTKDLIIKKEYKEKEKDKSILIDAIKRKSLALLDILDNEEKNNEEEKKENEKVEEEKKEENNNNNNILEKFNNSFDHLCEWVDIKKMDYLKLWFKNEFHINHYGLILNNIKKNLDSDLSSSDLTIKDLYNYRQILYKKLNWDHLIDGEMKCNYINAPNDYALF